MSDAALSSHMQAVFISDLHLHSVHDHVVQHFFRFLEWVQQERSTLYILGDFFHVWYGDDAMDEWATLIALRIAALVDSGVACYFMPGNRDFLLGDTFARLAKWTVLPDPFLINLGSHAVLLSHGDRYCTADRAHQFFRWLTRPALFRTLFMQIPLFLRCQWVKRVRQYSTKNNRKKSRRKMDVVRGTVMRDLQYYGADILIHGHTHQPKKIQYEEPTQVYTRYVLSDWDDKPMVLCYNKSNEFKLEPILPSLE